MYERQNPKEGFHLAEIPNPTVELTWRRHGFVEQIELLTGGPGLPRPMRVCVHRVGDTLIDTGSAHTAGYLVAALQERPPKRVLLTHQHEDHIGGASVLREAFGEIPIHAPREHVTHIANHPPVPLYRALTWGQPKPVVGLTAFDPGDRFAVEGLVLEAWPTPGHTPGHIAFVAREGDRALVFTGDLYLGRRPLPTWFESAADDMRDSARRLAQSAAEVTVCPGHGAIREDGRRRLLELAEWLDREIEAVEGLAQSLGARDYDTLARARYGEEDPLAAVSGGEFSHRCLVRAILDPVRRLPVEPP